MDDKIIMDEHVFDKIDDVDLKKTMESTSLSTPCRLLRPVHSRMSGMV